LAAGVKAADSDIYLYEIDLNQFEGDKVELIKAQNFRALDIMVDVAKAEYPGVDFHADGYDALFKRGVSVTADYPLRSGYFEFMDNKHENLLYILNDAELKRRIRRALNQVVIGD